MKEILERLWLMPGDELASAISELLVNISMAFIYGFLIMVVIVFLWWFFNKSILRWGMRCTWQWRGWRRERKLRRRKHF